MVEVYVEYEKLVINKRIGYYSYPLVYYNDMVTGK